MNTLHQTKEYELNTSVSEKKVVAGWKAALAALAATLAVGTPQITDAQDHQGHQDHTIEASAPSSKTAQAEKTANFTDYTNDTKEKTEKQEIPDHFAEAEDIMYKYYPNYQKHFDEVFRKISGINPTDKALINTKIHEFLSDYNEIVITNEEERMIALLGFCEAITGTWKFHEEQLTFSEELKDMVKDFFKEVRDAIRAKNEFLDAQIKISNQKVADSRKQIEELDKKIAEIDQKIAEKDKQIAEKDKQIADNVKELEKSMNKFLEERRLAEEMIVNFELEDFLQDEVKQGYVKAYIRHSRKYALKVLPKAEALVMALEKKK